MKQIVWLGGALIACGSPEAAPTPQPPRSACVDARAWTPISTAGAPTTEGYTTGIWAGGRLAVLGPDGSATLDPCTNRWKPAQGSSALYPEPFAPVRGSVIADSFVISLFGNYGYAADMTRVDHAADIYDVDAGTWRKLQLDATTAPRAGYIAVWTGTEVVVWGGESMPTGYKPRPVRKRGFDREPEPKPVVPILTAAGFAFDPRTLAVRKLASSPLSARTMIQGTRVGSKAFIWGGLAKAYGGSFSTHDPIASGAIYDPATDRWKLVSTKDAPSARPFPGVYTVGSRALVFGGQTGPYDGGVYDPATDTWQPIPAAPTTKASMFFIEDEHVVVVDEQQAYAYDLAKRTWKPMPAPQPGWSLLTEDGYVAGNRPPGGSFTVARPAPREGRWKTAKLPPLPVAADAALKVLVWNGRRMVAWGVMSKRPGDDRSNTPCFACRGNLTAKGWLIDVVFQ